MEVYLFTLWKKDIQFVKGVNKVSPGIEPGLKDSKSLVIPLHHETNTLKNYTYP